VTRPLEEARVGPAPAATGSVRLQVARVALGAALTVDGVTAGSGGPLGLRVTQSGSERLVGVVSAADASGGYAVTLHLVVRVVPLGPLAERIRSQVGAQISAAGLADELARLDIVFEDIASAEGA
jgi:hypothetical protein